MWTWLREEMDGREFRFWAGLAMVMGGLWQVDWPLALVAGGSVLIYVAVRR